MTPISTSCRERESIHCRDELGTRLGVNEFHHFLPSPKHLTVSQSSPPATVVLPPLQQPVFIALSTGCAKQKLLGSVQSRLNPGVPILRHTTLWKRPCFGSEMQHTDYLRCSQKLSPGRTLQVVCKELLKQLLPEPYEEEGSRAQKH